MTPPGIPHPLIEALADRYRLERELGQGGMATVYLAEDVRHRRRVAVKVLKSELAAALGADRFLREIETTAGLRHPHILPLYDSGEAAGFLFYVMPYVEGESLQDRLDREKQLPQDEALQIAREVADALNYAHQRGVIHRDIKPGNIMLESGHAVVADFGIARALSAASADRLTQTGMAVGTPAYMSPEQAAGTDEVDGRSDLYALGCVLYEMLAGQPPFTGPTVESIVRQHLTAPPVPVTTLRPSVPAAIANVVERALAKNPADRFSPVAQFADALGSPAGTPPSTVAAPAAQAGSGHSRPVRWATVGLGIVLLVAASLIVGRTFRPPSGADNRSAIAVLPFQNLSAEGPNSYFAGGLHDELLTQLSKVSALTVMGRTSVMGYVGTSKTPQQIAEELGVGSLVEGSVQVLGDRLRVNVQLLDAATGAHLWAESYDRTLDDAFAIQSDIARQVVGAVGAALSSEESGTLAARPTDNAEAYQLFLQGEDYRQRSGYRRENFENALQLYERALALDPGFALAWAGQAEAHGQLYWLGYDTRPERLALEQAAAERAMALAPDLPQARSALGRARYHQRDFVGAGREFEAVAAELPGWAEAWRNVATVNRRLGRWTEVETALARLMALEPRDATHIADLGGETKFFLHRYPEALADLDRALALAPDIREAQLDRARLFLHWRGELDTLRKVIGTGAEFDSWGPNALWAHRLALLERNPDPILESPPVVLTAQSAVEPSLLYAGWAHQLRGDRGAARAAFTAALVQLDSLERELPGDWRIHASRGLALAALGRGAAAGAEAAVLARSGLNEDPLIAPILAEYRAMIFAHAGLPDSAVALLRPLMAGPSWTSPHLLRLDPRWDPIRDHPGFQALLSR